jgi:ketosteroid isomerase-like protein
MKRFSMILAAVALSAALVPACAQVDAKAKGELLAAYGKVVAALKKKDLKTLMSMITPDAVMKEAGQTMNRAQFEATMKQQLPMMDLVSAKMNITKLVVKGDTASAEYTEDAVAMMTGAPGGKKQKYEMSTKYKGTFKKVGGEWKMRTSETVGQPKILIDGKPAPGAG